MCVCLQGRRVQTLQRDRPDSRAGQRLLLVGGATEKGLNGRNYRKLSEAAAKAVVASNAKDALCTLAELPLAERELDWRVRQSIEGFGQASYRFEQMKSKKSEKKASLQKINFPHTSRAEGALVKLGILQGRAIIAGMALSKDLSNLPGNVATPSYLAAPAKSLGRS